MARKYGIGALFLVFLVTGMYYFVLRNETQEPVISQPEYAPYTDDGYGFTLSYPIGKNGYLLSELPVHNEMGGPVKILILENEEAQAQKGAVPQNGEGAPVITILVFSNVDALDLRTWAQTNILYSGFDRIMSEVTDTVVGAVPALRYTTDGLYATETIVVGHNSHIFVFLGPYIEKQSKLHDDFASMIESVHFIKK